MPIEIKVGPPILTISQGRTFMVTDTAGEITATTTEGLYAIDTRFISDYKIYINRIPLALVNSSQLSFYASRIHLTNPQIETEDGILLANTLRLTINRMASAGIHEGLEIANYTGRKIHFILELAMRSDFADLFEVKSNHIVQRGKTLTEWDQEKKQLRTTYDNQDYHRATSYHILSDVPVGYANGQLSFEIELEANEHWYCDAEFMLEHGQNIFQPTTTAQQGTASAGATPAQGQEPLSNFDERQKRWQEKCTSISTSNNSFYQMYQQAVEDMGALRIYDMDVSDEAWVPAAGVPWFVTLFGRDSLTVSYQNMAVSAGFGRGALQRLAEFQATQRDDWRDAQPGKILHEIRFGELAHFQKVPFTPYYGTADATILFVIVLSETYRWTGDHKLLLDYREAAERCLEWMDTYGDLDGDGFQEYKTFSTPGYANMGWKDAGDAVVYADGTQVEQPKGLCELQGYVYDAKTRMAEIYAALGETERAQELQKQAQDLKQRFNQIFWMEDEGCFAYGLDPKKQQITTIASNAGQCLWSGIADADKARRTAQRLLQTDMWSGWGIRTLSSSNPAYNPFEYQRGSVWPQDNGIIADGFKRYELPEEANSVIRGIFDAIERFDAYRPPELFAGIQREGETDFPILYPGGANIPQAWATGSIFHMLRTILGLRADAPAKKLYVHPTLPTWLPDIELHHLRVGECTLDLKFWREGEESHWQVLNIQIENSGKAEDAIEVLDEIGFVL